MTDQEQRMAIAEACPHLFRIAKESGDVIWNRDGYEEDCDLLNDLNAMHEAECCITVGQMGRWLGCLSNIVQPQCSYHPMDLQWWTVRATARQRAESFLRTIGKWTDK